MFEFLNMEKMDMDMDMGMNHSMSMSMHMFFHNELDFYMLFEGWMVMNQNALIGSCFGWVILSIIYEGIKGLLQSQKSGIGLV